MKLLNKAAEFANRMILFAALILTVCLSFYGLYVLCDIFYINHTAFVI